MALEDDSLFDDRESRGDGDAGPKPRSVWDDPNVPAGNAPPRSKWMLMAMVTAWSAGVVFLVAMVLSVRQSAGR